MIVLSNNQISNFKEKLINDDIILKKSYKFKKNLYHILDIETQSVNKYRNKGWEIDREFKTKVRLKKEKQPLEIFKDQIWCQFYELGFRCLNIDNNFILPFGNNKNDTTVDIIAIYEKIIFLIEYKSNTDLLDESYFNLLNLKLDSFKKTIKQVFNDNNLKIKYIIVTKDSNNYNLLLKNKVYHYNNETYEYINNLVKNYKGAALYQFLGLILKGKKINNQTIDIPAVEGQMGGKKYYMFSLEANILLKISFILHRSKANNSEFPNYQRLLKPNRIKGITKFIDDGGYFPNSIIISFSENKDNKLIFKPCKDNKKLLSKHGILKIPNAYAIAYIIDGQHRLYGYANSNYLLSNTIPVLAFNGLTSDKQLQIFMDINQNQKAVSADLLGDLEEDLYWNSTKLNNRLKALKSAIIKSLSELNSPLYDKISIGEEKRILSFKPFSMALEKSKLLPQVKGNMFTKYIEYSLYDTDNQDSNSAMNKAKNDISELILECYKFIKEEYPNIFNKSKYFIISDRGIYALITLIGDLNFFLVKSDLLNKNSTYKERFKKIKIYLDSLLKGIETLNKEEKDKQLKLLGSGAYTNWLRFFQKIVNNKFTEYSPKELVDWKERQNEELQDEGRKYGEEIEAYMKKTILFKLKESYGEAWEIEIASIKRDCVRLASEEQEKNYKDNLGNDDIEWTTKFTIIDYSNIIKKYWAKQPNFQTIFAINIGLEFNRKLDKMKWISIFNKYRNLWSHSGTNEKRLNKEEVEFLKKIHKNLIIE